LGGGGFVWVTCDSSIFFCGTPNYAIKTLWNPPYWNLNASTALEAYSFLQNPHPLVPAIMILHTSTPLPIQQLRFNYCCMVPQSLTWSMPTSEWSSTFKPHTQ
jgi:hypothetical protein